MKNDNLKEQYRINERIRVREVRLVGDNIETGVYPIAQALKIAEKTTCPKQLFMQTKRRLSRTFRNYFLPIFFTCHGINYTDVK